MKIIKLRNEINFFKSDIKDIKGNINKMISFFSNFVEGKNIKNNLLKILIISTAS